MAEDTAVAEQLRRTIQNLGRTMLEQLRIDYRERLLEYDLRETQRIIAAQLRQLKS